MSNARNADWQYDAAREYVLACRERGECPRLLSRAGEEPDPEWVRWVAWWEAFLQDADAPDTCAS